MSAEKNIPPTDEERDEFSTVFAASVKENPFVVPDGYFDELPGIIQDRCVNPKKKNIIASKLKLIIARPEYIISLCVILIAVVFISIYPKPKQIEKVVVVQNNELETKLNDLIDENEIDESLIIETLMADTDTVKSKTKKLFNPENKKQEINLNLENPEITPDDILQYLLENEEEIDPDETL
jgi:hypothetical protein